ncbi:glycerate dehydrogenase-like [Trifolium pratense]|uniref:glycerate dehydrogenase-like n=1 Tax=Trifolium pratense TaxID=57577 RepID=UPI001E693350|nr:glycerate dehydrogenase-like [Trifolium pratense]
MDEVLQEAISFHPILDKTTYHLVNKERLAKMKKEAILINCSRGPVIDEVALVDNLRHNPMFRVGLDVFEDEPYMKPGLAELKNAIVVPHIASASKHTVVSWNTLINGYFRNNCAEEALRVYSRMMATSVIVFMKTSKKRTAPWNAVLSGFRLARKAIQLFK